MIIEAHPRVQQSINSEEPVFNLLFLVPTERPAVDAVALSYAAERFREGEERGHWLQ